MYKLIIDGQNEVDIDPSLGLCAAFAEAEKYKVECIRKLEFVLLDAKDNEVCKWSLKKDAGRYNKAWMLQSLYSHVHGALIEAVNLGLR